MSKDKIFEMLKQWIKDNWKKVVYSAYHQFLRPQLEKWVLSTETKFDDKCLAGIDHLVETMLKPEEPVAQPAVQ